MQKINSIPKRFWDIEKFLLWVFWGYLIMPSSNDNITLWENLMPKVLKLTCRKFWCLFTCKKSTSFLNSFLRYCKDIVKNCYFVILDNLGMPCHTLDGIDSINLRKHLTFICSQKINFILHFFLDLFFIVKILWTYFGYFGQAWLCTPKVILSVHRRL